MKQIKVYRVEDVKRIVAFIPKNHYHIRLLIEFKDQSIIIQEAVLAAITRAYLNILLHPTKRACELTLRKMNRRKHGYAKYQLIETSRSEEEIVDEYTRILFDFRENFNEGCKVDNDY